MARFRMVPVVMVGLVVVVALAVMVAADVPQRLNTFPTAGCAGAPDTISVGSVGTCTAFDCTYPSNLTTTACPASVNGSLGLEESWGAYVVMGLYSTANCADGTFTNDYATVATGACVKLTNGVYAKANCSDAASPTIEFCGTVSSDCSAACTAYSGTACQLIAEFASQNVVLSCQTGTAAPTATPTATSAPSAASTVSGSPPWTVLAVLVATALSAVAVI